MLNKSILNCSSVQLLSASALAGDFTPELQSSWIWQDSAALRPRLVKRCHVLTALEMEVTASAPHDSACVLGSDVLAACYVVEPRDRRPRKQINNTRCEGIAAEEMQSSRISSHRVCSLVVKASGGGAVGLTEPPAFEP
ncbi:hypothetical protein AOLI_G00102560 [Acnodon oligacanthus]